MRFSIPAVAIVAIGAATTHGFVPATRLPAGAIHVSLSGRPGFLPILKKVNVPSFELYMVGGGKDEEAESNLNEYKKKAQRITEHAKTGQDVRTLCMCAWPLLIVSFILIRM